MKYNLLILLLLMASFVGVAQTGIWQQEAENGALSGAAKAVDGCGNASGGKFVEFGTNVNNTLTFSNIQAESTGTHLLSLFYFHTSETQLTIEVNGAVSTAVVFPTGIWCYQGAALQVSLQVELNQGVNTLVLKPVAGQISPLIDRLNLIDPSGVSQPRNYYVSSSEGNDSNDGLSPAHPWVSLVKTNDQFLNPGDSVLFKSGDTFIGQLTILNSGTPESPLYFGSYGEGALPLLDGAKAEGGAHLTTIEITNQDNIEIANLEITNERMVSRSGVSDVLAYGINVTNSGSDILRNYHFHDLTVRDVFALSVEDVEFDAISVAAINFTTTKNTELGKEKNIQDVLIEDCYITRTTRLGIKMGHGGGSDGVGNDSINRNQNLVFRNNYFYQTGGTCILPNSSYNTLIEHNTFEEPGSDVDPRMANRGSSVWFWNSQNAISQFNSAYHVRGYLDSYGQHIDYGNRNIMIQYNYSEDSEGGFVEILGDNVNSVFRFNVSVNDGVRESKGNTLWVSDFAGENNRIKSDSSYIYNNSVYVDAAIKPDIEFIGKNIFVYNNIFHATGAAAIGQSVNVDIEEGSQLHMSNNLYFGNISAAFRALDANPAYGKPLYDNPGGTTIDDYKISTGSAAINAGKQFPEPKFPNAGKGIFKDVTMIPNMDLFGNSVNVSNSIPNIGADNHLNLNVSVNNFKLMDASSMTVYPNPIKDKAYVNISGREAGYVRLLITDLKGGVLQSKQIWLEAGDNKMEFLVDSKVRNGIYLLSVDEGGSYLTRGVVVSR